MHTVCEDFWSVKVFFLKNSTRPVNFRDLRSLVWLWYDMIHHVPKGYVRCWVNWYKRTHGIQEIWTRCIWWYGINLSKCKSKYYQHAEAPVALEVHTSGNEEHLLHFVAVVLLSGVVICQIMVVYDCVVYGIKMTPMSDMKNIEIFRIFLVLILLRSPI